MAFEFASGYGEIDISFLDESSRLAYYTHDLFTAGAAGRVRVENNFDAVQAILSNPESFLLLIRSHGVIVKGQERHVGDAYFRCYLREEGNHGLMSAGEYTLLSARPHDVVKNWGDSTLVVHVRLDDVKGNFTVHGGAWRLQTARSLRRNSDNTGLGATQGLQQSPSAGDLRAHIDLSGNTLPASEHHSVAEMGPTVDGATGNAEIDKHPARAVVWTDGFSLLQYAMINCKSFQRLSDTTFTINDYDSQTLQHEMFRQNPALLRPAASQRAMVAPGSSHVTPVKPISNHRFPADYLKLDESLFFGCAGVPVLEQCSGWEKYWIGLITTMSKVDQFERIRTFPSDRAARVREADGRTFVVLQFINRDTNSTKYIGHAVLNGSSYFFGSNDSFFKLPPGPAGHIEKHFRETAYWANIRCTCKLDWQHPTPHRFQIRKLVERTNGSKESDPSVSTATNNGRTTQGLQQKADHLIQEQRRGSDRANTAIRHTARADGGASRGEI